MPLQLITMLDWPLYWIIGHDNLIAKCCDLLLGS